MLGNARFVFQMRRGNLLHQKDGLIELHGNKMKRDQKVRFVSWKSVINKILREKVDMKMAFEAQIRKFKRQLQHEGGSSSFGIPSDLRL